MDISKVDTNKCNIESYNEHEQIYIFNELYRKYNGKPKKKEVVKKTLKEKTEDKKDQEKTEKGTKRTPMDAKFKKNLSDGIHKKLYESNCNGDTHDQLAKEYGISKYMVSKLIKAAREERKQNQSCKVESEEVKQPEQKEEVVPEVETTA